MVEIRMPLDLYQVAIVGDMSKLDANKRLTIDY